jgi:methionyl-tRNA formyltransferase
MRLVFMGSPEFAVPALRRLAEAAFDVALVVSQPDRRAGRGRVPTPPPIAAEARRAGLRLAQPERLRGNEEFVRSLGEIAPDAIVVVAYGRILPREILEVPRFGCVNLHASLLPRHRGASPIQAAILAGDAETGVCAMRIVEQLDAGPLYGCRATAIGPAETGGELASRLAVIGAGLLIETLHGVEAGTLTASLQRGEPTYCRPVRREEGRVDWNLDADEILRRLRAFTPWPGIFAFLGTERVKILRARRGSGASAQGEPGAIEDSGDGPAVVCGSGSCLLLVEVQREGRQPVSGPEFLRGLPAHRRRFV